MIGGALHIYDDSAFYDYVFGRKQMLHLTVTVSLEGSGGAACEIRTEYCPASVSKIEVTDYDARQGGRLI
jgi:hypothetical protein